MDSSQEHDDVEMLTKEGRTAVTRRNISKAIAKYQEAYKIANTSGKHEVVISCACNLGAALLSQGDVDQAIEHLDHALNILEAEKLPKTETLRGDILFNLGLAHSTKRDIRGALRYFGDAADIFRECSEFKGFADSCQQLGEQYLRISQPLRAAECFCDAREGYLNSGRIFLTGKMVVRQAQNLYHGGKSEKSLAVLIDLDKLYSKIQDSNTDSGKLAKLFCDAGSLLFQLRSPDSASVWLHRALDLMRSSQDSGRGNQKLEARILLTLGETSSARGDFTKAVTINREASVLYGKLENKKARGQCFYQLAEAYRHLGDHHNAEKYYHIAHQTLEDAGLHSFLWQVLEGLADLNYQRRQLDTSISYYRETIDQLSQRDAHPSIQRQIVNKLATALEVQRVGVVKAESYKNRVPVLVEPEKDLIGSLAYQNGSPSPEIPLIQSPIYAPLTSTRLGLYSSIDHSQDDKGKLEVPGKKKKRKSTRKGRRRSGSFDKPVTTGVGEYDTETDISLIGRRSSRKAKKPRASERSKLARLESEERVKTARPNKTAPRRLLSHIRGLEIDEVGSALPVSSVDDSTQMDPSSGTQNPRVKGFNMAFFLDSDTADKRGQSASQTIKDSYSSTSDDDNDDDDDGDSDDDDDSDSGEQEDSSFTEVSKEEDGTWSSSDDVSEDDSDKSEEELKHLDEFSLMRRLDNTYEHPSPNEPMYATIKSRKLQVSSGQDEDRLYESLHSAASTARLNSTIPKRTVPSIPSPPEPPRGPRPLLMGNHSNDQSYYELEPAGASWDGPKYPKSSVLNTMSRGQREMGLHEVARLEQERKAIDSRSSLSSATSDAKVPKSRACIVM